MKKTFSVGIRLDEDHYKMLHELAGSIPVCEYIRLVISENYAKMLKEEK